MAAPDGITVPEVLKALGKTAANSVVWSIGAHVRDAFIKRYGQSPEKALRTKTSGSGSHCFAVYPEEMRPVIEAEIAKHETAAEAQKSLF